MSVAPEVKDAALWIPPIQRTISIDGSGVPELAKLIAIHAEYLRVSGDWAVRERVRLESEMDAVLQETLVRQFRERVPESKYDEVMVQVYKRSLSPREAVRMLTNGRSR